MKLSELMEMVDIIPTDKKLGKNPFFYDYIGIGLVITSVIFFIKVIFFLGDENFVAAIIGTLISYLIFSAGINLIKTSAIAKMTGEESNKEK